jgi:hypothetical protein
VPTKRRVDGLTKRPVDALDQSEVVMENTLVTELRSITAAALTAMSAAERANWEEAEKCVCDLGDRVNRVQRQISDTNDEPAARARAGRSPGVNHEQR